MSRSQPSFRGGGKGAAAHKKSKLSNLAATNVLCCCFMKTEGWLRSSKAAKYSVKNGGFQFHGCFNL